MWKKNLRSRGPVIGNPVLLTTTFDNATLENMTTVTTPTNNNQNYNNHNHHDNDRHSPSIKPTEPDLRRPNPPFRPPVASSIYSKRDSYAAGNMALADHDVHPSRRNPRPYQSEFRDSQYTDISPPDSPVFAPTGHRESPDVSPIDNNPPQFPPPRPPLREPLREGRLPSAVPVPSKNVTRKPNAAPTPAPPQSYASSSPASPNQESKRLTRWDDFSGEPTHDEKGKIAQATPGSVVPPENPPTKQSSKQGFNFIAKGKELNQARRKFMDGRRHTDKNDKDDPALSPSSQEPWKGASGRAAIVKPIETKETPRPRPPQTIQTQPRKVSAPGIERKSLPRNNAASGLPPLTISKSKAVGSAPDDPTIKPIVPLKAGNNTPTSAKSPSTPTSRSISNGTPARSETPRPTEHGPPDPDLTTGLQNVNLEEQPSSRFSTTTYATTEAPSSPPGTPRARMAEKDAPPLPAIHAERTETISSRTFVRATKRKPTPSEITSSSAKTLPRSPPELEAENRIEAMEARLKDLAQRRGNIDTILHELTQVIQPSSIAYDLATRSEVKKSVNSLNNELMEIRKEEHDVGMKLMRARKKQDQGDYYQGSSIWVKRVTEDY
ncbi:conserved hypothetical protein [Histoplasma capsulatum G186AR]|uniref:Uncharacterized protein n=2 Tax=Ajellomyces capsulatus TaxID=5037 RepID=C0NU43_AJECG|nr:uncharacterized protein HCBG_06874 [Histoplasma capsulatum G186AR]EEH04923.1 conserved hypothetical protein [Histoplasma capsulatum G186AR]KAG5287578.1 DNA Topoisomerase, subtype IA domain containing protein [Histoplasma capsulatum]QSS70608.1 DNA Topoisomerase, subtype IA domain containing protein [Histoplasma capsulatum G186AR]